MHRVRVMVFAVVLCVVPVIGLTGAAKPVPVTPPARDAAADINTARPGARHVTFDTTEGTWMSVDVSPDGKTLVFDLLGDLYTVPIAGGAATALTRGPAFDNHPRYSPDGTTIAFTSDEGGMENLWLVNADGSNRRALTTERTAYVRSAAWLPGGDYLVARKEEGKKAGLPPCELWLFHRMGGSGVKLTSSDELNDASGPVGSRDGRFIYFAARAGKFSYDPKTAEGLWQIYRFDRTTGERATLTSGIGGAARPAVSPDGKTLVFVSRRDADTVLVARTLATGAERVLLRHLTGDDQEGFAAMDVWPNYAFTPDGSNLVLSNHGKIQRLALAGDSAATDIPFKASVDLALAPTVTWQDALPTGPVEAKILRRAHQSPDGQWIVLEAFGRCWLQRLDAGKPSGAARRLTADGGPAREYTPAFSPDGQWVAFATWTDADGGAVWKARTPADAAAAGVVPVKVTTVPGHYANPSWSPSGDRLAAVRGSGMEFRGLQPEDDRSFDLVWFTADGGEPQYVTSVDVSPALRFHPQVHWSHDGTRLYYARPVDTKDPDDDTKIDLVSVRLDGTDARASVRLPPVDDLVPSPDGRWLLFSTHDEVYVTALPPAEMKTATDVATKDSAVPVWRLTDEAGGYSAWADGGKAITWTLGNTFRRLTLADAMTFADQQRAKAVAEAAKDAAEATGKSAGKKAKKETARESKADEPQVPPSTAFPLVVTLPRAVPSGALLLANARVITMKGDEILPSADLLITGNRITAVGAPGTVTAPPDVHRVDLAGATLVPGLIDTHAHLHYSGLEVLPETKWEYAANLAYGVTTTYDPSAPSLDVFEQGEMVEAGRMLGPRIFSSGDILYGGQQAAMYAQVDDQDDARKQIRRMQAYGARMVKVYQQPRRDQRLWFAQACRDAHMRLTVEGAGEMQTDLSTVVDGFTAFEHALPYELHDDVIQLLAHAGTYYTPTLIVAYGGPEAEHYYYQMRNPHDDEKLRRFVPHRMIDLLGRRHTWVAPDEFHFPVVAQSAALVKRAGGHVSLGAHGQLQGLGAHWELWALTGEGDVSGKPAMTPLEALRSATRDAADKLGLLPDLGTIEAGKLADLVVLDADPLADIHNSTHIRWVVKNGTLFDGPTLTEEWPDQRPLPKMFWQEGQ